GQGLLHGTRTSPGPVPDGPPASDRYTDRDRVASKDRCCGDRSFGAPTRRCWAVEGSGKERGIMELSDLQVHHFRTFGYLALPRLFAPDEIAWVIEEFETAIRTVGGG